MLKAVNFLESWLLFLCLSAVIEAFIKTSLSIIINIANVLIFWVNMKGNWKMCYFHDNEMSHTIFLYKRHWIIISQANLMCIMNNAQVTLNKAVTIIIIIISLPGTTNVCTMFPRIIAGGEYFFFRIKRGWFFERGDYFKYCSLEVVL